MLMLRYNKNKVMKRISRQLRRVTGVDRFMRLALRTRLIAGAGALLIVVSLAIPVAQSVIQTHRYNINPQAQKLMGKVVDSLNKKLTYDSEREMFQFNKNGESNNNSNFDPTKVAQQKQVGSNRSDEAHLYSTDLPRDLRKGIMYYDNQQGVSFTMTPQFSTSLGRLEEGRLVYPLNDMAGQAVYTVQNNGLREDIIVNKAPKNSSYIFGYHLDLPDTLEARAIDDGGAIGIYSADPSLFGNVSYGSSSDQSLVMTARKKSAKNYLVFTIPAPVIEQNTTKGVAPTAKMTLNSNSDVRITVSGLNKKTSYPLNIDPSVVVNSSSTFAAGNQEGNIDIGSSISRGALTGGTTGNWTTNANTAFTNARYFHGMAVYNGYAYIGGGLNGSGALTDIQYAKINSDGSVAAWTASSVGMPGGANADRYGHGMVAYNGYMYIMGGYDGTTYFSDIYYAKINSDGTLNAFQTAATALPSTRYAFGLVAYNNHFYLTGGSNATIKNDSYYATINGDGSISSWTTGPTFTSARLKHGMVAYNGYIYIAGGNNGGTYYNDVQYAKINSDGSIGSWMTTSSFATGRYSMGLVTYDGYMYLMGGNANAVIQKDTQYARINANGGLGAWATTIDFTSSNNRYGLGAFAYNGYVYVVGGHNTTPYYNDTLYAKINPAGDVGTSKAATTLTTAVYLTQSVAYNGYMYMIGGNTGSATGATYYAPINADGSLGSWTATSTYATARYGASAVAYNGYMYLMGGYTGSAYSTVVQRAVVNAAGTLGAWSTTSLTALPTAFAYGAGVAYNGYLYYICGSNASTHSSTVYRSTISATGTNGAWSTSSINTTANAGRDGVGVAVYGGRVYILGGNTGSGDITEIQYASFNSGGTLSSWTIASHALPSVREKFTAGASNGYLYAANGTSSGSNFFSDINFAPIQTSGDVGTWATSTQTLTNGRYGNGSAFYNGYMYVLGGAITGNVISGSTEYLPIGNGGTGGVGTWSALTTVDNGRYDHGTVAYNGYLYVIGGWNGSTYFKTNNTTEYAMEYAAINADGTIGAWQLASTTSNMTTGRYGFGIAVYNGYIYIAGGYDGTNDRCDTQYIPINANGSITAAWSNGSTLPAGANGSLDCWFGTTLSAYNGYLYAAGGVSTTYRSTVYYAQLNANGSMGAWTSTGASLASGRYNTGAVAYNGYLYVAGGTDDSSYFSDLQYAQINANGTLGSFVSGPALPTGRDDTSLVAQNGFLYLIGGYALVSGVDTIYGDTQEAAINTNGSLGNWASTTAFPTPRAAMGAAAYGGYIFLTGGVDNASNYNLVSSVAPNAMSRSGSYSKMIDLGAPATILSSLTYTGTTGNTTVTYQSAGSNGVFGSAQSASSLNTTSCGYNQGTVRYVYIFVSMNDSQAAAFADANATTNSISNITLQYLYGRAPTNARMHGGKYFSGETQLPLDTCGP